MCSVNIAVGREERYGKLQYEEMDPAPQPKRVLVIGGGPSGMEAARVAALRGHNVTLFEKRDKLGGALIEASIPEFKKDLLPLINYLSTQIRKLGVKVELGKEATADSILTLKPDTVIVATGSRPLIPGIPGIENAVTADDVLDGKIRVGRKVVVIGGGFIGRELAVYLGQQDKEVSVVEILDVLSDISLVDKGIVLKLLDEVKARIMLSMTVERITKNEVAVGDKSGNKTTIPANTTILAVGRTPVRELYEQLKGKVDRVMVIGDCIRPRMVHEAIYEGHIAGRMVR